MADKLDEREIVRLVAEVSKLEQEKQQLVTRDQVADILRELNLSDSLLDEAMVRLRKRDAATKKGIKMALITLAVAAVIGGGATMMYLGNQNMVKQLAAVSADQVEIKVKSAHASPVTEIQADDENIYVSLILHDVPLNESLPLHATWQRPDGSIYHENNWHTKQTSTRTWDTHAKCEIDKNAPLGTWLVKIFLADRLVATKEFVVK